MASNKAALKAAKAAIDARKYDEAIIQAQKVLEADPGNYHANVFLGLAYEKSNEPEKAINAYLKASKSRKDDPLAWQGLVTVYEQQGSDKVLEYKDAALRLAEIYAELEDRTKCQSVVDKFLLFAKAQGSRDQYKIALELILPSSSVYECLEGRIPHPSITYMKIADLVEADEKERINKQIGERRTRLGAKLGSVTSEVKREVFSASPLESLYQYVIDWTTDDSVRYQYEERLLARAYDTLGVLSGPEKIEKREKVSKISHGMVILKREYQLPWDIVIEWADGETVGDWDVSLLRGYVELFPESGLGKILKGYLQSELSPFPHLKELGESDKGERPPETMSADDCLLVMIDGFQDAPKSILANRLMTEYYLYLEEYESTVETSRRAFPVIDTEVAAYGVKLDNSRNAISLLLATALIYYQSPKNHGEAQSLFNEILEKKPMSTAALIGSGLILEEQGRYKEAKEFLNRALKRDDTNVKVRAEAAWCQALDGNYQTGLEALRTCAAQLNDKDPKTKQLKSQITYRIGMCVWNLQPDPKSRKNRKGAYFYFLEALKGNINYAPAYTILGSYYADYAGDKKRARKCFQKAFELSASETEAAERLASSFADSGDWDLVEVVAARVIDSGKAKPSPGSNKKGFSWPFAALGVVQLNKQAFSDAIVSFQSSLRISPGDYHSWVGLGESYHNSGRYIAATRAFQQAEHYESEAEKTQKAEKWFARYMLANVKRELGDFDEAIQGYRFVMESMPREFGVSVALVQTLVEYAWRSVDLGFFGRAADCAVEAIEVALEIAKTRIDSFNLWKALGDACSIFSWVRGRSSQFPLRLVQGFFALGESVLTSDVFKELDETMSTTQFPKEESQSLFQSCLSMAIVAQKGAIIVSSNDIHAQAVAWYNLGWAEFRAYVCSSYDNPGPQKKKSSKDLRLSMKCFKRAIELEAGNSEFWNALGLVTTNLSPKVAQHSFVRSLFLNERSARVWTNLGTFYLLQNDVQLANDAFTRAQSSDPDYAQAWLGQGLLAQLIGQAREAHNLFTHAFEIADSSLLMPKRQYALSTFDIFLSSKVVSSSNNTDPIFVLRQLASLTSGELAFQHLFSLFSERVASYQDASNHLEAVCEAVEQEYEISESNESLSYFAQAKADLARSQLATQNYSAAVASAETSLDLSSEDDAPDLEQRRKSRLSAHLTAGLASYFLGNMDRAIAMFKTALDESGGAADVVCLLAQVLWAKGGKKERRIAQEQLMDCVEAHPDHVQSVALLGVISLLEDDKEAMEAVVDDLESLRASGQLKMEEQQNVSRILTAIADALEGNRNDGFEKLTKISTSILLSPSQPYGWAALAEQTLESYPADMALITSQQSVILGGNFGAEKLADAFAETMTLGNSQRAILMAPWSSRGWKVLDEAVKA